MPSRSKEEARRTSQKHRDKYPGVNYERVKRRKDEIRDYIREYKNKPCQDCGICYPYYVMHLDHRDPSKKKANPSNLARLGWGIDRVKEELAKCDIVCSNCHAERTYGDNGRLVEW